MLNALFRFNCKITKIVVIISLVRANYYDLMSF